ncbi:hypothetical protein L6164_016468 [Bauhinia variegata]|uniref:Uncharacterized protein n=1 Tax=Bauhinia variegata TaxID=167791 RepID=A0ACB9NR73_BAUVA|nr:hypothetical protein L6164_016468 [Bauhinia variegata]
MASKINFIVGSNVWVEDPEVSWIDGEIVEVNGDSIKINCTSGKMVDAKPSNIHPMDPEFPPSGVEDMTKLAYLHEPGVLLNLKSRYDIDEIYTYTGGILIAVNPFQRLPQFYGSEVMGKYKGAVLGELSPHPFAIADTAYRMMINEGASQSILVSGESGAGKTESTKMLMQYLAFMGGRRESEERSVEQQVLESNPVLEAFGNAKTVRNNNSSRFGKFVELQFDRKGRISGAAIRTYLLEKSRVCQVSDPERNYHCFYMLCAAPKEVIDGYKLGNPRTFHYLNQSNCYELEGLDESKEYLATRRAMGVVGISSDEQEAIFRIVAAILHLGNIEFSKGDEADSSQPKDDQSRFHLKTAAELFMCDEKSLEDSLCKRVIVTRGEAITKWLDPQSAVLSRDALAKIVYSKLFDWMVNKINNSIGQDKDAKNIIGVLDIYGFESFKTNSFEQFCINLTNEKLQQHFNQHVFKMEQEEYTKEEINWSYIEFVDNQDVLDLIEKKPGGILALLDEACMFPRSTHETFAEKLYQTFKDNKRFSKPKLARSDFTISHYAGDVTYQTLLFLDKNKDFVVPEHEALLAASKCPFVSGLFPPSPEESSKSSKFSSIGTKFKQQLQSLLETLNATEPQYVRCIKPNNLLKPGIFNNSTVLQQLQCGGVMEAIRISCAGYPTRKTFSEFVRRFGVLSPEILKGCPDEVTGCKRLLEKVNLEGYQIGKTKVFLRAGQMAELDGFRAEVLGRSATIIQRRTRTYYCHKNFTLLRLSAIEIQTICRGEHARRHYDYLRKQAAAVKIQQHCRKYLARKAYKSLCTSAVCIQTSMRAMAARIELTFRKRKTAAVIIQSYCRRYLARIYFLRLKRAAITAQCWWRRRTACRELRKLKMAAKDAGALQEAKIKLEKQVEELTENLELERKMRADIEEAKAQENSRLRAALHEMELQFKETKALLIQEREATKRAAEGTPTMMELPVSDNELINKLTAEIQNLKAEAAKRAAEQTPIINKVPAVDDELINKPTAENENLKVQEAVTKTAEQTPIMQEVPVSDNDLINKLTAENENLKAQVTSLEKKADETEKHATEAELKIIELKTAMQRLEEKLSDMETEDQILRQQALSSASKRLSEHVSFDKAQASENGDQEQESPSRKAGTEADASQIERPQETIDTLLKCVEGDLGFSEGKPVAAFTIYKCLLHWKSFEAEKTSVFDRLIQLIGAAIEDPEDNNRMAYWLSNTSGLLFILQQSLRSSSRKPPTPTGFFGRMAQGFRSSSDSMNLSSDELSVVRIVEAKYPALLFKQQLTAYVEIIYGIIRDNLKKNLSPLLSSCIQAPKTSEGSAAESSDQSNSNSPSASSWHNIIDCLNKFFNALKENYVPAVLVQKIFTQIFSYINVQLFNSLIVRGECCTFSNGEYVKSGLDGLEKWCDEATEEYVATSWDELKHIRQAIGFLIISQKSEVSYDDLTHKICPVLGVQQLYRLCTLSPDENDNTKNVSPEVISSMKLLMTDNANDDENSYLLDDVSSVPFAIDDIISALHDKTFRDAKPPEELLENPDFEFLK